MLGNYQVKHDHNTMPYHLHRPYTCNKLFKSDWAMAIDNMHKILVKIGLVVAEDGGVLANRHTRSSQYSAWLPRRVRSHTLSEYVHKAHRRCWSMFIQVYNAEKALRLVMTAIPRLPYLTCWYKIWSGFLLGSTQQLREFFNSTQLNRELRTQVSDTSKSAS